MPANSVPPVVSIVPPVGSSVGSSFLAVYAVGPAPSPPTNWVVADGSELIDPSSPTFNGKTLPNFPDCNPQMPSGFACQYWVKIK